MADLTLADVTAGVQAALAAYTQALDDGRTDDVVATFCPDGAIDLPGMGTHEGHDALRAAIATYVPGIVRFYDPETLAGLVEAQGFTVEKRGDALGVDLLIASSGS